MMRAHSRTIGGATARTYHWPGIGRVRKRLDLSDRRGQTARLEDISGELRHDGVGPNFSDDALDLEQELRCFWMSSIASGVNRKQRDTGIGPAVVFRMSCRRPKPISPFPGSQSFALPPCRDIHSVLGIAEIELGVQFGLQPALTTSGRCSMSACGITMKPPSRSPTEAPVAKLRASFAAQDVTRSAPRSPRRRACPPESRW